MSLRGVHILFIVLSVLLSFAFAAFEWMAYRQGGAVADLIVAVVSALIGGGLAAYGAWFILKPSRSTV
jgi:hypothetical protein